MPRISTRNAIDTDSEQIGQEQTHIIPSHGDLDREDFKSNFATIDTPMGSAHVQELMFMEELVQVMIPFGANPETEEQFVDVGNNGVRQFIERGVPQWVKRKYVEVLARAKRDKVSTPEFIDPTGAKATKIISTPSLIHGFNLIEDKNPNGHAWLRRILAEA